MRDSSLYRGSNKHSKQKRGSRVPMFFALDEVADKKIIIFGEGEGNVMKAVEFQKRILFTLTEKNKGWIHIVLH
jgi:hypothetical protein